MRQAILRDLSVMIISINTNTLIPTENQNDPTTSQGAIS
jgi:hypothetical protein